MAWPCRGGGGVGSARAGVAPPRRPRRTAAAQAHHQDDDAGRGGLPDGGGALLVLGDDLRKAKTPVRSIAIWTRVNTAAADYGEERLGERYLRVRFEDLCAQPGETVRRIYDFFGLDGDAEPPLPVAAHHQVRLDTVPVFFADLNAWDTAAPTGIRMAVPRPASVSPGSTANCAGMPRPGGWSPGGASGCAGM